MPPRAEVLKQKVEIIHRSKAIIAQQHARIQLDDRQTEVKVEFYDPNQGPHPEDYTLKIADIETVKPKDFSHQGTEIYTISVTHKDGQHTQFTFKDKETRHTWDEGLRQLTSGAVQTARMEVKVPASKYVPIKGIVLKKPKDGQLTCIEVEAGSAKVDLVVPADQATSDGCRAIVHEFVEKNYILPTEQTSLYRYVKSVVQRAKIEKEVAAIVEDINEQSIEKMATKLNVPLQSPQLLEDSRAALTRIWSKIPERIGQNGSGATIVAQVLKRNVDKMKLINDMASRLAQDAAGPTAKAAPVANGDHGGPPPAAPTGDPAAAEPKRDAGLGDQDAPPPVASSG